MTVVRYWLIEYYQWTYDTPPLKSGLSKVAPPLYNSPPVKNGGRNKKTKKTIFIVHKKTAPKVQEGIQRVRCDRTHYLKQLISKELIEYLNKSELKILKSNTNG
jgi:hypothetical protein